MSHCRSLSKKNSLEERPSLRYVFKLPSKQKFSTPSHKTSQHSKRTPQRRVEDFDLYRTKRKLLTLPSRQPTAAPRPETYFQTVTARHRPTLDAVLLDLFFDRRIDEVDNSELYRTKSDEESMEVIKLGKSVRMSKAVVSLLSDTQKSTDCLLRACPFTPWDMNTSSTQEYSLKGFRRDVRKLSLQTAQLPLKPVLALEMRQCLARMREILDEAMSGGETASVSNSGTEYLNATSNI